MAKTPKLLDTDAVGTIQLGENVRVERKGATVTITIILNPATATPSSSNKTLVWATSRGNVSLPGKDGLKLGLNLYGPKE